MIKLLTILDLHVEKTLGMRVSLRAGAFCANVTQLPISRQ